MKRVTIIALSGLAISVGMIAVVALNDRRLVMQGVEGNTLKSPFMTKTQQHNLMMAAIIPVIIGGGIFWAYGLNEKPLIAS